ncbi:hypothetical protein LTSEALA_4400 [Salmonella enterica subsp. enterica serovar Alachua str. R6-377]|uniref:Uncharacterized protein n=1 Tax=Salmonella enterica subsp. enterica serovar Alachua str. R6-377 TaxID=913241 RepID=G5LTE6_SALET|nr:hypothetical protein LTSEALA_4400 [Salmonella enterica subsp. enterica serovar Alachua str. R6-377]
MGTVVMHIVKIKRYLELAICRPGKEIQATVFGEKIVSHFNDGRNGGINKDIIKSCAIG